MKQLAKVILIVLAVLAGAWCVLYVFLTLFFWCLRALGMKV